MTALIQLKFCTHCENKSLYLLLNIEIGIKWKPKLLLWTWLITVCFPSSAEIITIEVCIHYWLLKFLILIRFQRKSRLWLCLLKSLHCQQRSFDSWYFGCLQTESIQLMFVSIENNQQVCCITKARLASRKIKTSLDRFSIIRKAAYWFNMISAGRQKRKG